MNLVTGALRVTAINSSGANWDRPSRQVGKAEEELHGSELSKADLHPWDGGPGHTLAFHCPAGELTGSCLPRTKSFSPVMTVILSCYFGLEKATHELTQLQHYLNLILTFPQ